MHQSGQVSMCIEKPGAGDDSRVSEVGATLHGGAEVTGS